MHFVIYDPIEFKQVFNYIYICLKSGWWRAGREVVMKLATTKVKCKISEEGVENMINFAYALLFLSVSEENLVEKFLNWAKSFAL